MKRVIQATIVSLLMLGAYVQADPIELSPGDEAYNGFDCGLCGPGLPAILGWLHDNVDDGFVSGGEAYKSEWDDGSYGDDSGPFADDYTTAGDTEDATISWDGGDMLTGAEWLLVKDGNNDPIWYLFDITGWDGMMDIELTDFWPGSGAISHVSIWGGDRTTVPEPGTLALLGLGLLGAALVRRRITV